jgi:Flp pilus assembly protein CpaB
LLHHPSVRRAVRHRLWAGLVAVLVAAVVLSALERAERGHAAWGRTVDVVVARHDLDAGELIGPAGVSVERWPVGLVADGALHELPSDRRLASGVRAGELVVDRRLAPPDSGPTGAGLARGEVVVSLPLGSPPAAPAPGDHVDIYAPDGGIVPMTDPSAGALRSAATRLATRSRVLAVRPDAVDVAVDPTEAQDVAAAVLGGMVALVVVG